MAQRTVSSVARALKLLEELRDSEAGLGVNELARRIGVNASTASRLLATLEASGMVERDPSGGPFRLGLALVTFADRVLSRLDVQALARPLLVELMEQTGETATLSLPGERETITVDSVPSRERAARDVGRQGDARLRRRAPPTRARPPAADAEDDHRPRGPRLRDPRRP
jgi:IclR family acetate operon transcriptional repressor